MLYLLGILAALLLGVRWTGVAEALFYFPSREAFRTPAGCEDVWFASKDGTKLHGWFIRASDAAAGEVRPAVLHCHGNAGNIESHAGFSSFLVGHGVHVFIFDYRGYGRSDPGRPRRGVLLEDASAAFDALAARDDVGKIGVYGVSLGGVFALGVAGEKERAASVCTVSAFSSWAGVAGDHTSVLGRVLMGGGLDPVKLAPRLGKREYLIVHGDSDDIVPARHAAVIERAAEGAGVPARRVMIAGAGHNEIMDFAEARDGVAAFFVRTLEGPRENAEKAGQPASDQR